MISLREKVDGIFKVKVGRIEGFESSNFFSVGKIRGIKYYKIITLKKLISTVTKKTRPL